MNSRAKLAFLCSLACMLVSVSVDGRIWHVERDGSGDYTAIQPAVDGSSPGDTILLGPGRYIEHGPFSPTKGWPIDTYVGVTVDHLTFIGTDRDAVIIGPATAHFDGNFGPKGFVTHSSLSEIRFENLTCENLYTGIYLLCHAFIRDCTFQHCATGIVTFAEGGVSIETSLFRDNNNSGSGHGGVKAWYPASNLFIVSCDFNNDSIGTNFAETTNANVLGCNFQDNVVGIQYERGSTGTVHGCQFGNCSSDAINVTTNSSIWIENNNMAGGQTNLEVAVLSTVAGTNNVLHGGTYATIVVSSGVTDLHGNHFLRNGGLLVRLEAFVNPPDEFVDLTGNYWGYSEAESISVYIRDGSDVPSIHGFVEFEPFSAVPLQEQKSSLGGVKGLYR